MAVVGALGAVAGGAMGMMQANYQAQVADMNAKIARENARVASARGGIEAQLQDMQAAQTQADQLTQQAASGVSVAGESQIKTRETARWMAAADRMRIRENANYEAYGYKVQAANFKAQARDARVSGIASLAGGVLSGIGSAYENGLLKTSLIGGATPTAAATTTVAPKTAPVPIPKPKLRPMPTIGRPQSYFNPLTRKKMGTY